MMNNKANKRTSPSDRRQKNIKGFAPDKRQEVRRDEDRKNLKGYYVTLIFSFSLLASLGIASYIYELYK